MGVIMRVERVHGGGTQCLVRRRSHGAVIDKVHLCHRRGRLAVADKAVRAVGVRARLPNVVRRRRGDDHMCTFGLEDVGSVDQVLGVGKDDFGNTTNDGK